VARAVLRSKQYEPPFAAAQRAVVAVRHAGRALPPAQEKKQLNWTAIHLLPLLLSLPLSPCRSHGGAAVGCCGAQLPALPCWHPPGRHHKDLRAMVRAAAGSLRRSLTTTHHTQCRC